jgi:hypothetical protein
MKYLWRIFVIITFPIWMTGIAVADMIRELFNYVRTGDPYS